MAWRNELVTPVEWCSGAREEATAAGPELYVAKAALQSAFTSEGRLITPLAFKSAAGDTQIVVDALTDNSLTADCLGVVDVSNG